MSVPGSHESVVQLAASSQLGAGPATQAPFEHASAPLQKTPSLQSASLTHPPPLLLLLLLLLLLELAPPLPLEPPAPLLLLLDELAPPAPLDVEEEDEVDVEEEVEVEEEDEVDVEEEVEPPAPEPLEVLVEPGDVPAAIPPFVSPEPQPSPTVTSAIALATRNSSTIDFIDEPPPQSPGFTAARFDAAFPNLDSREIRECAAGYSSRSTRVERARCRVMSTASCPAALVAVPTTCVEPASLHLRRVGRERLERAIEGNRESHVSFQISGAEAPVERAADGAVRDPLQADREGREGARARVERDEPVVRVLREGVKGSTSSLIQGSPWAAQGVGRIPEASVGGGSAGPRGRAAHESSGTTQTTRDG